MQIVICDICKTEVKEVNTTIVHNEIVDNCINCQRKLDLALAAIEKIEHEEYIKYVSSARKRARNILKQLTSMNKR